MPERNPSKNILFMAGSNLQSGTPNTGQILMTQAGTKTWSRLSGVVGGNVVIWPGAGRLHKVTIHSPAPGIAGGCAASGAGSPVILYDSAVTVVAGNSGAPFPTSGHTYLDVINPAGPDVIGSPIFNSGLPYIGRTIDYGGRPFTSGLSINGQSGQPGITVEYTPVISG